jgi:ribonucleoside-diphosphate reductase beta chain
MVPNITQYRAAFKPFEYPQFYEIYRKARQSVWTEDEANMTTDFRDWQLATEQEREVIGGILRGFTTLEAHVGEYWGDIVTRLFPKHEIVSMARWFSANETTHAVAYAHLNDTLGLDDYEAFLGDPTVRAKINLFLEERDPRVSLGVFSGAVEGVSLFGSFSVLLSFSRNARFRGLRQIISWSILDEQMHSDAAILLYRQYVKENGADQEIENQIIDGFKTVLANEEAFLSQIFQSGDLPHIAKDDVLNFLYQRANERLTRLGLFPVFTFDETKASRIREWFDPLASGLINHDFFASSKEGSGYVARPEQKFDLSLLSTLELSVI